MNLFSRLFSQIYPNQPGEKPTESEVLVREPIKHNKVFLNAYQKWKYNEMHHGLLNDLNEKRAQRKEQSPEKVNYFEVQNSTYSGFYFYGEPRWSSTDYTYLVHYFLEQLTSIDYFLANSVREVIEAPEELKTTEQFYFKPALKFRKEPPYNQLYGNLEVEHKIVDGETKMVKLMSSVYKDQHYNEAMGFDKLLNKLFLL